MIDTDGLPLDEVGEWADEKHLRLTKYINAARFARKKFLEGKSHEATYIDLFCGSGRSVIRETGKRVDGSPVLAFKCAKDGGFPFSAIHIGDTDQAKCSAATKRIATAGGRAQGYVGRAEVVAPHIVSRLNPYGLHFAFLDPFNLQDLAFAAIETLATLKRMDILIHVSVQDLQRNLDSYTRPGDDRLDRFAPDWRGAVDLQQSQQAIRAGLFDYWRRKIDGLGLPPAEGAELVSGHKNQRLYWLVFVSRHKFAKQLWGEIRDLSGQRTLL